jgi:O-antigen/teichoic acid export membrane protein
LRRIGWGFTDQALSSATNFALALFVARSVDAQTFGSYSLAFAAYLLLLGAHRSLFSQPFMVRVARSDDEALVRDAQSKVLGGAVLLGLVAGTVMAATSLLADGDTRVTLIVLGAALPGLLVQDAWRFIFLGSGRPAAAALNDLCWAVVQGVLIVVVLSNSLSGMSPFVIVWGISAALAALFGFLQRGVAIHVRGIAGWLRAHGDIGLPFLGQFGATYGTDQATLYGIGAVASVATVGVIQAADVLVRPLNFIAIGATFAAFPEGVRLRDRSVRALRFGMGAVSVILVSATVALGVGLLLLPERTGQQLLGENWAVARPILVFVLAQRLFFGASAGARMGLQVLGAGGVALRTQVVLGPMTLAANAIGAMLDGARGAVIAGAFAMLASAVVWWWRFLQSSRSSVADPDAVEPTTADA